MGIEAVLLGLLAQGPRHAYALYQELRRPDGLWLVWRLKPARLYAMLDRLEQAGLIVSETVPQERRPARRVFRLTPAGEACYLRWRTEPVRHGRDMRQLFLAKLYLARRDGVEVVRTLLENQQAACRQWLADFRRSVPAPESFGYQVWRYRVQYLEALLHWLRDEATSIP